MNTEQYRKEVTKNYKRISTRQSIESSKDDIRILIIEDNLTVQKYLHNILKRHLAPCTCIFIDKCYKSLELLQVESYDLILMDTTLDQNIEDCSSSIRGTTEIPIILLALSEMTISYENMIGLGADGIVYKPIKLEELLKEIKGILEIDLTRRGATTAFHRTLKKDI